MKTGSSKSFAMIGLILALSVLVFGLRGCFHGFIS